jgi:hypothetical protein
MGIKSGLTKAFVISREKMRELVRANPAARKIIHPFLQGRCIRRYSLEPADEYLIYTPHGIEMSPYPAVLEYLLPFRQQLENRATQQHWYELQQPQFAYKAWMEAPKIVFPDIARSCRFTLDASGHFSANTVYFIPTDDLALLGLLNSRLAQLFFIQTCAALEGPGEAYLRFFGQYLEGFPVKLPPADEKNERNRMTDLVRRMLDLHERLRSARTEHDRRPLLRTIAAADRQIDELVYELYGLTDEEIAIVEATTQ